MTGASTASELIPARVAHAVLKQPKSELSDFSRPLRAPPEASADKTELTADGAFRASQVKRLARVASMA